MPRNTKTSDAGASTSSDHAIDDIVSAFRDERVIQALGNIFEAKLHELLQTIHCLKTENVRLSSEVVEVQKELNTAKLKIVALEAYNRRDNLIITGIPPSDYADVVVGGADRQDGTNNSKLEETVLELCNTRLDIPLKACDISIIHKLKQPQKQGPCPVIIRFVNRKTRDMVYSARRKLHSRPHQGFQDGGQQLPSIYINEDLPKETASLFRNARQLVKEKKIFRTWTSNGTVYIKHSSDENSKPIKVISLESLQGL
jgi:hypothetical protein